MLFTIDKDNDLDIDYTVIGEVNDSDKIQITLSTGEVREIENRGYNHYVSWYKFIQKKLQDAKD